MSAEVERAIYNSEEGVAWHGLGQPIPASISKDPAKMAALLGCDWTVKARPTFYQDEAGEYHEVKNASVQVRSDTGVALSVTSANRYHTENRQPVDILEAFRGELAQENLTISHAAVLRGGQIIAVSALVTGEDFRVGKDALKNYVTLSSGYDKIHGTAGALSNVRVVCMNTLEYSLTHNYRKQVIKASQNIQKGVLSNLVENIQSVVEESRESFEAMRNTKISDAQAAEYFCKVLGFNFNDVDKVDKDGYKVVATKSINMLNALISAYKKAPGAQPGNVWGSLNAVTYYAGHEKTCRDTTGDGANSARLASNLFGSARALKLKALEYAGQLVAA